MEAKTSPHSGHTYNMCREAASEHHHPHALWQRATRQEAGSGYALAIRAAAPARQEHGMIVPPRREFERSVLPHLDAAYNLARWLVGDATLAEDVVQDAALRGFQYFVSFRGGNGRVWLLRIVRNTAYGYLQGRRVGTEISLGDSKNRFGGDGYGMGIPTPDPDLETNLVTREEMERLETALAALPVEWRECLLLREIEQLSYKDIAWITQVPIGTVMARLSCARHALTPIGSADPESCCMCGRPLGCKRKNEKSTDGSTAIMCSARNAAWDRRPRWISRSTRPTWTRLRQSLQQAIVLWMPTHEKSRPYGRPLPDSIEGD
jgi:RNA polymerase sigma factor (sigma-70 family)